jgi:hypothetical protein
VSSSNLIRLSGLAAIVAGALLLVGALLSLATESEKPLIPSGTHGIDDPAPRFCPRSSGHILPMSSLPPNWISRTWSASRNTCGPLMSSIRSSSHTPSYSISGCSGDCPGTYATTPLNRPRHSGLYVTRSPRRISVDVPLEQARGYFQHNVLLSVAADTGLIGLTMFVALLALWTTSAWRLGQRDELGIMPRQVALGCLGGIVAYFTAGMFQDVLVMPMIQTYLFFIGALVVTVSQGNGACLYPVAVDRGFSGSRHAAEMSIADGAYRPAT